MIIINEVFTPNVSETPKYILSQLKPYDRYFKIRKGTNFVSVEPTKYNYYIPFSAGEWTVCFSLLTDLNNKLEWIFDMKFDTIGVDDDWDDVTLKYKNFKTIQAEVKSLIQKNYGLMALNVGRTSMDRVVHVLDEKRLESLITLTKKLFVYFSKKQKGRAKKL